MAITVRPPYTIYLGGGGTGPGGQEGYALDNTHVASAAISPGMLVEPMNDAGTMKYRKHATSTGIAAPIFALEQLEWNDTLPLIPDATIDYATGDLVKAAYGRPGSRFWAIIGSGENIVPGDFLASAGNGKLTESSTNPVCRAIESSGGAVTVDTRLRVEVI